MDTFDNSVGRAVDCLDTKLLDRLIRLELSTVEFDTDPVPPEPAVALAVPQQPVIRNVPKRRAAGRCDANRLEWLRGKQL